MKIRLIIISLLLLFLSVITPIFAIPTGCSTDKNAYKYQCRSGGQIVGSCETSALCNQFNQNTFGGDNWKLPRESVEQLGSDLNIDDVNDVNGLPLSVYNVNNIMDGLTMNMGGFPDKNGNIYRAGALGNFSQYIAQMVSQPPASTTEYLADLGRNAGVISQAYAQDGMGWTSLTPVLKVWKAFRNIAYMAFVIVFIVLGFMIMFRNKLNGQTVLTIQMALPQIIITLLLITFSYAIASLMIDLIYILIYLVIGIFSSAGIVDSAKAETSIMGKNIIGIAGELLNIGSGKKGMVGGTIGAIDGLVERLLGDISGKAFTLFSNTLGRLIILIAILLAVLKIFWTLLKSYIGLILSIIFAPIILIPNALPGSKSFSKWLMSMFSSALAFPITAVIFIIASSLSGSTAMGVEQALYSDSSSALKVPFLIGGLNTGDILTLVGFGILMVAPNLIEMAQKAIGGESALATLGQPLMQNLGQGLGGAMYVPRRGVSKYMAEVEKDRAFKENKAIMGNKDNINRYGRPYNDNEWYGRLKNAAASFVGWKK